MAIPANSPYPADIYAAPISERDLALRWNRSARSLQRWRAEGTGPAWLQIGGSIFYRWSDVIAFENNARRGGTP